MSEKKEEEFLAKIKQIIQEEIRPYKEAIQKMEKPKEPSTTSSEPKHEHWKAEDISDTCPECIAEKTKIGKDYAKKEAEASKNLDYECVECGTHFGKKEKKCPSCGKTNVRSL